MSDVWERIHNNGNLFPSSFHSDDDDDSDGWSNAEEAAAGTDPRSSLSTGGMLRPEVTILHDVILNLDNNGNELYAEVATITWPIIAGKFYTLLYSPDMSENSWITLQQAAAISDGTRTGNFPVSPTEDKKFWRVTVEDMDSDGDGLTDAEEYKLGTDPHNAQTIADIPDFWLAKYFTNVLLAGNLNMIDPDADPNNDGYTIMQEAYLNVDPINPNNLNIGKEAIINGDFSDPVIGTHNGLNDVQADPGWDYWGEGGVTGWTAVFGHNIELQTLAAETTGNQYVELKAHPAGHYGIQQQVATRKGMTYLLALRCRDRADVPAADSNFNILIDGAAKCKISFDDSIEADNLTRFISPGAWKTVPLLFTAEAPTTWISLVPAAPPQ